MCVCVQTQMKMYIKYISCTHWWKSNTDQPHLHLHEYIIEHLLHPRQSAGCIKVVCFTFMVVLMIDGESMDSGELMETTLRLSRSFPPQCTGLTTERKKKAEAVWETSKARKAQPAPTGGIPQGLHDSGVPPCQESRPRMLPLQHQDPPWKGRGKQDCRWWGFWAHPGWSQRPCQEGHQGGASAFPVVFHPPDATLRIWLVPDASCGQVVCPEECRARPQPPCHWWVSPELLQPPVLGLLGHPDRVRAHQGGRGDHWMLPSCAHSIPMGLQIHTGDLKECLGWLTFLPSLGQHSLLWEWLRPGCNSWELHVNLRDPWKLKNMTTSRLNKNFVTEFFARMTPNWPVEAQVSRCTSANSGWRFFTLQSRVAFGHHACQVHGSSRHRQETQGHVQPVWPVSLRRAGPHLSSGVDLGLDRWEWEEVGTAKQGDLQGETAKPFHSGLSGGQTTTPTQQIHTRAMAARTTLICAPWEQVCNKELTL